MPHAPNPHASKPTRAPDPASSYERSKPHKEAGMGRLDHPAADAPPTQSGDGDDNGLASGQQVGRQLNSHDDAPALGATANIPNHPATRQPGMDSPAAENALPAPEPVDHTMFDEEPLGADQRPLETQDPEKRRHPRTEGKGGAP